MKSIVNLLTFLNENWTTILVCIGLLIGIYNQTKNFFSKKHEDQVKIVKSIIKEIITDLVAKAEKEYGENKSAGVLKRSQVIKTLYTDYPILSKVSDQEEIIKLIDTEIDNALENVRAVFTDNQS